MRKLSKPDSIIKEIYVHDHEDNPDVVLNHEMFIVDFLMKNLKPDSNFMDIGAYQGYFTLIASKRIKPGLETGIGGMIYSFEPCISSFEIVKKNVELHNLANVKIFNMIVCDKVGNANIYWRPGAQCISRIFDLPKDDNQYYPNYVPTISLDGILEGGFDSISKDMAKAIDYMKIDIEGAEVELFRGAKKFFDVNKRCKVILELHCASIRERGDVNLDEFVKSMEDMFDFYTFGMTNVDMKNVRKCLDTNCGTAHYILIPR